MSSRFHQIPTRAVHVTPHVRPAPGAFAVAAGLVARARQLALDLRESMRASPWTALVGRTVFVAVALVILAWIGRAAANTHAQSHDTAVDGGVGGDTTMAVASSASGRAPLATGAPASPAGVTHDTTARSDGPAPNAAPQDAAAPARGRATPTEPVYLNHAGLDDLRRLPGVGPKRAQAIVALRQRIGRFHRVEDLLRVKGVGRATLRKWRPVVRLDAPPPPSEDAGSP